jgi:hypothetical protein
MTAALSLRETFPRLSTSAGNSRRTVPGDSPCLLCGAQVAEGASAEVGDRVGGTAPRLGGAEGCLSRCVAPTEELHASGRARGSSRRAGRGPARATEGPVEATGLRVADTMTGCEALAVGARPRGGVTAGHELTPTAANPLPSGRPRALARTRSRTALAHRAPGPSSRADAGSADAGQLRLMRQEEPRWRGRRGRSQRRRPGTRRAVRPRSPDPLEPLQTP